MTEDAIPSPPSPTVRRWVQTVIYLAIVAGLGVITVAAERPWTGRCLDVVWNTGHVLVFGLVAVVAVRLIRVWLPRVRGWVGHLAALLASLMLGAAVELLQQFDPQRSATWGDLVRDFQGAGAFLLFHAAWCSASRSAGMAGLLLLAWGLYPLAHCLIHRLR